MMSASRDPLRHLAGEFELLGIEVRPPRLFDGQGKAGSIHVRGQYALLVLDRWREQYQEEQLQIVVPSSASVDELWTWINDAAGIWPVDPLGTGVRAPVVRRSEPPPHPTQDDSGYDTHALRLGDRESRTCWNGWCSAFGTQTRQVLIKSRPGYRLWSCDECKCLNPERRR